MTRAAPGQEWFSAAELAELKLAGLPTTERSIRRIADGEGWADRLGAHGEPLTRARRGRGGGIEYHLQLLPECARAALTCAREPAPAVAPERLDRDSAWARFERLPRGLRDTAVERLTVLNRVDDLVRAGLKLTRAIDEVTVQAGREARLRGAEPPFSIGAVYDWSRRVSGVPAGDRLPYLAPSYTGRTVKAPCPAEAFELYKADFLRAACPSASACYRRLERIAAERGWTLPSQKTLERRLTVEVPLSVQILHRKGKDALDHSFPHLTRDRADLTPLQRVNLDGHTWDVRVRWEDGTVSRPLSVAVQDIASSKCLAIRFDRTLNSHLVRLALGDTFREHGLAETVLMDNGRENAARLISGGQSTRWRWKVQEEEPLGLLASLGIKALFATPYWGQAKPIERMFRDFAGEIAKHPAFVGAYTGPNTSAKPHDYGSTAVPIAEFERIVRDELRHYNAQRGRAGVHLAGRSFDEAWAAGVALAPPRRATPEQLRMCMLASQAVSMDRRTGEVAIDGHRYWSAALGDRKRAKVTVRFDPEDLSAAVHVYSLDGVYIGAAERIAAGSFDRRADAQEQRRKVSDHRKAVRLASEALVRLAPSDVAARLNLSDSESTDSDVRISDRRGAVRKADAPNILRPAFGAPRSPEQAGHHPNFEADWEAGVARLTSG